MIKIKKAIVKWLKKMPEYRMLSNKFSTLKKDTTGLIKENEMLKARLDTLEKQLNAIYPFLTENDISRIKMKNETGGEEERNILADKDPLVSIIIISRNGMDHLKILMNSFTGHHFYSNFEIIFVDNASRDRSVQFVESFKDRYDITVIHNDVNMTFSAANNIGADRAKGDYLLFLNNDIEVTDYWLDELLITALTKDKVGAVGAKLLLPDAPGKSFKPGEHPYSIQHNGVRFKGNNKRNNKSASYINGIFAWEPYHIDRGMPDYNTKESVEPCACVTGAVLLLKKDIFYGVNRFDERYNYGYEDVDLCLKVAKAGYVNYICRNSVAFHYESGTQSEIENERRSKKSAANFEILHGKWHGWLSERIIEDKLNRSHYYTNENLVVTFVVTESGPDSTAGDYFTAKELAASLERLGYETGYVNIKNNKDKFNIPIKTDVLIVMLDAYDISQIHGCKDDIITVAWARNWIRKWCEREWFNDFDIVLASSESACIYIEENSNHNKVYTFPIATNPSRFNDDMSDSYLTEKEKDRFRSDYCFTGSYWHDPRTITDELDPEALPYKFKIFGANWETVPEVAVYSEGFIKYDEIPEVYKHTKIVIDDANMVNREFGCVNSRVFDALVCGRLVLTNGKLGAEETFRGLLPTFEGRDDLRDKLDHYLSHEDERIALAAKLKEIVLNYHTYDIRAKKLIEILNDFNQPKLTQGRIDILSPHPLDENRNKSWGDIYYSQALSKELGRLGYSVNVVPYDYWGKKSDAESRLVLHGLRSYYLPESGKRKTLLWVISRSADLTAKVCNEFDYVFFASDKLMRRMEKELTVPHSVLLQCTDPDVMKYKTNGSKYELLFVGSSKGEYRPILKDLLPTKHKLTVIGKGWDKFPVKDYVKNEFIDNNALGQAYHDAEIVLNDHQEEMKEDGIINNRIYDVLAADSFVISDEVEGIDELFEGNVVTYKDKEDLKKKIDYYLSHPKERKTMADRGREIVLEKHTFAHRAKIIDEVLKKLQ